MNLQHQANKMLEIWQLQRRLHIPAASRVLPVNDNRSEAEFEADLAVIRSCLERRT